MKVEEIYQILGQSIVDSIEDDWIKAKLDVKYTNKSGGFHLNYWDINKQSQSVSLQGSYQAYNAVKELHKITTKGGNNKWNRLKFQLTSDGEMDLEFIWDQELYDELDRLSND